MRVGLNSTSSPISSPNSFQRQLRNIVSPWELSHNPKDGVIGYSGVPSIESVAKDLQ